MNHYFDDVFSRHLTNSSSTSKPKSPRLRRSSTARSMGARSDFDVSTEGGDDDYRSVMDTTEDPERERERREADLHTANYVSEQLSRVRSNASADFEDGDEFEAQLDGQ
jgi:hypothetical protein